MGSDSNCDGLTGGSAVWIFNDHAVFTRMGQGSGCQLVCPPPGVGQIRPYLTIGGQFLPLEGELVASGVNRQAVRGADFHVQIFRLFGDVRGNPFQGLIGIEAAAPPLAVDSIFIVFTIAELVTASIQDVQNLIPGQIGIGRKNKGGNTCRCRKPNRRLNMLIFNDV